MRPVAVELGFSEAALAEGLARLAGGAAAEEVAPQRAEPFKRIGSSLQAYLFLSTKYMKQRQPSDNVWTSWMEGGAVGKTVRGANSV